MRKIQNSSGEFNFEWLFAIIAGVAILLLALYGVSRISNTQRYQIDTETAKKIAIITDPMQAGFASASFSKIEFQQETRMYNDCFTEGFGKNTISIQTRSGVLEEWQEAGGSISVHNKYIFSSLSNEGKEFYVFSMPFNFPYKISDLLFITQKNYCFSQAPEEIKNQISGLKMNNIQINNCTDDSIEVCFNSQCDISVYGLCEEDCESIYDEGKVIKGKNEFYYTGNLMYAAIFSDKNIYDCNVQRLLFRAREITKVLIEKSDLTNARDCNTNLKPDLILFDSLISNSTSNEIIYLNSAAKSVEKKEEQEVCGLW